MNLMTIFSLVDLTPSFAPRPLNFPMCASLTRCNRRRRRRRRGRGDQSDRAIHFFTTQFSEEPFLPANNTDVNEKVSYSSAYIVRLARKCCVITSLFCPNNESKLIKVLLSYRKSSVIG